MTAAAFATLWRPGREPDCHRRARPSPRSSTVVPAGLNPDRGGEPRRQRAVLADVLSVAAVSERVTDPIDDL